MTLAKLTKADCASSNNTYILIKNTNTINNMHDCQKL